MQSRVVVVSSYFHLRLIKDINYPLYRRTYIWITSTSDLWKFCQNWTGWDLIK